MRIVFVGTSEFAVPSLTAILASRHEVAGVLSQPDRPRGRGLKLLPSPVKAEALARGLAVWTPEKPGDALFLETLRAARPDAVAVASYGRLLPQAFLDVPPKGCVNVHPSLVPRYRGASPIPYAILNGDAVTGVSIFRMVRKMDAGPVYARREAAVGPEETAGELEARLAPVGGALLVEVLDALEAGTAKAEPQDEAKVVMAPKLEKEQGRVDWSRPEEEVARRIRALNPWPRASVLLRHAGAAPDAPPLRVQLLRASAAGASPAAAPGEVVSLHERGLLVAAGSGAVLLTEVQPEGKKAMPARDFANGYRVRAGDTFSAPSL